MAKTPPLKEDDAMAMLGSLAWLAVILLTVTGTVIATLGWRGRRILTTPRCSKCDHDLRRPDAVWEHCPECGVDLENGARVTFGRFERRPMMIVAGVIFAIGTPMMTVFGASIWNNPPAAQRTLVTIQAAAPPPRQAEEAPAPLLETEDAPGLDE